MRAIGYQNPGDIDVPDSLQDIELPRPEPGPGDLLVEVRAVSVNPVDTKVRRRAGAEPGGWKVLGWDAAGVVVEVGADVTRFAPGARFPRHRHHGPERVLVLEGAFADDSGREVRAGDEAEQAAGSAHELVILGDVPCVTAVMEQGLEFTQGWLRLLNHFVR